MKSIKHLNNNLIGALSIAICVGLLITIFILIFSFLGYGVLLFAYIFILTGLIVFYRLTSILTIGWTVLSFIINFILWTAEQVLIEKKLHDTILYQEDGIAQVFVLTLGALLFAFNKILIDLILISVGVNCKKEMRIERIIKKIKAAANKMQ